MRAAYRLAAALLAALVVGCFCLACTTSVKIRVDEAQALERLHTWSWLPRETRQVEAATEEEATAIEQRLRTLVGDALRGRGFVRARGPADFYVAYALRVDRQMLKTWETLAEYELSSMHSSPSYVIQARRPRFVPFESARLAISVVDRRSREIVWHGELSRRAEGAFAPHLGDSVAELLEPFPIASAPPPAPDSPGSEPSRPRMFTQKPGDGHPL